MTWSQPRVDNLAQAPPARFGHSATAIDAKLYIIGGTNNKICFDSVYILDLGQFL
jgi:hypothetical protein